MALRDWLWAWQIARISPGGGWREMMHGGEYGWAAQCGRGRQMLWVRSRLANAAPRPTGCVTSLGLRSSLGSAGANRHSHHARAVTEALRLTLSEEAIGDTTDLSSIKSVNRQWGDTDQQARYERGECSVDHFPTPTWIHRATSANR